MVQEYRRAPLLQVWTYQPRFTFPKNSTKSAAVVMSLGAQAMGRYHDGIQHHSGNSLHGRLSGRLGCQRRGNPPRHDYCHRGLGNDLTYFSECDRDRYRSDAGVEHRSHTSPLVSATIRRCCCRGEKVLAGDLINSGTYLYDIAADTWTQAANKFYFDSSAEEGWARLADGTVITYDIFPTISKGSGYAERYDPVANKWSGISPSDGTANGVLPVLSSAVLEL